MGNIEFEGVGGGELRRVLLTGFMELDKAGMVCRIGVLGPVVFPAEVVKLGFSGRRRNVSEVVKG